MIAASSIFKLEKAQSALAQLGYRDIWDGWMLRAVQAKDKPADESGSEGLTLLQRGKAKDADEASCTKFQGSGCLTEVVLIRSRISTLPAEKIA